LNHFEKCVNLEPKEKQHREDLSIINSLIRNSEELEKAYKEKDYNKAETLSSTVLERSSECSKFKQIYVESLVMNHKYHEVLTFVENKVGEEDDSDVFNYYVALSKYYEGKYDESKKIVDYLLENCEKESKYLKLRNILSVIDKEKEKGY
jgi:hypothetical protein